MGIRDLTVSLVDPGAIIAHGASSPPLGEAVPWPGVGVARPAMASAISARIDGAIAPRSNSTGDRPAARSVPATAPPKGACALGASPRRAPLAPAAVSADGAPLRPPPVASAGTARAAVGVAVGPTVAAGTGGNFTWTSPRATAARACSAVARKPAPIPPGRPAALTTTAWPLAPTPVGPEAPPSLPTPAAEPEAPAGGPLPVVPLPPRPTRVEPA